MSDHSAAILELAALGGDTPLIRTTDGRSLRRVCKYCEGAGERLYLLSGDTTLRECRDCDGRGWLPVDQDTAVVVCLEWLRVEIEDIVYLRDTGNWRIRLFAYPSVHKEDLSAAVFEAAKRVAEEVSDG